MDKPSISFGDSTSTWIAGPLRVDNAAGVMDAVDRQPLTHQQRSTYLLCRWIGEQGLLFRGDLVAEFGEPADVLLADVEMEIAINADGLSSRAAEAHIAETIVRFYQTNWWLFMPNAILLSVNGHLVCHITRTPGNKSDHKHILWI